MPAKIAVITYSMYGHIDKLAESVEQGLNGTGAIVSRFQLPETLPDEILAKMHAPPKKSFAVLEDPNVLKDFDGFLFGFPTRYGRAPAQVSSFFDKTGGLWMSGALLGKFAGIFTSTSGQHGGHETTALTTLPFLAHHGIIYVPIGYASSHLLDNSQVQGGAPWGSSTIAGGDGSRQPTSQELEVATLQGKSFGDILNQFVAGKAREFFDAKSENEDALRPAEAKEDNSSPPLAQLNDDKHGKAKKLSFFKRLTLSCGGGQENYET